MGAIVLIVGVIGVGAVITAVVVLAVLRSRRNFGPVTYPHNMGYPAQQPIHPPAQQPYPPTPHQGDPNRSGQPPQHHPYPYTQQPPHQGQ